MRELPAIDHTSALGRVQQPVRSLLRPADPFGQAAEALAGRALGSHRASAASHTGTGSRAGSIESDGCRHNIETESMTRKA